MLLLEPIPFRTQRKNVKRILSKIGGIPKKPFLESNFFPLWGGQCDGQLQYWSRIIWKTETTKKLVDDGDLKFLKIFKKTWNYPVSHIIIIITGMEINIILLKHRKFSGWTFLLANIMVKCHLPFYLWGEIMIYVVRFCCCQPISDF